MSEQTPIPADRINLTDLVPTAPPTPTEEAENAAIAAVVDALGRFAQPPYGDLQCSAGRAAVVAIRAAAPILLAAGRTAAAADLKVAFEQKAQEYRRENWGEACIWDVAADMAETYADGAARVAENDGCPVPACGRLHFPWCAPYGGPQATGFQSGANQ